VEYRLDGVLQANVTPDMSHLDAMKAMLQNDLDVGLVSELRDPESMRLFFQMAVTGHMMVSALHAPDALSALSRVLTVGEVEPRFVCETLRGVLDQRLVRRSCRHCRTQDRIAPADAKRLQLSSRRSKGLFSYNPGCELCNGTGMLGRVPVAEFLELNPKLIKRIEAGESAVDALRGALPKGHRTFKDDLLDKVRAGEISPPEAIRVLDL
jgi:type II secretory ATPase GspE/PulE/Tfp pilus assembly ATPase PilB-like protein